MQLKFSCLVLRSKNYYTEKYSSEKSKPRIVYWLNSKIYRYLEGKCGNRGRKGKKIVYFLLIP